MRGIRLLASLVVVALVVPLSSATADTKVRGDKNDVKGPLDIEGSLIMHGKKSGLLFAAVTYKEENIDLHDLEAPNSLIFNFDIDRDGRWERAVVVRYEDDVLVGVLVKNKKGDPKLIGAVEVGTIELTGAINIYPTKPQLGFQDHRKIQWSVTATYKDDDKCSDKCVDYAPSKKGWFEHRI